jgi:hypothetical protein
MMRMRERSKRDKAVDVSALALSTASIIEPPCELLVSSRTMEMRNNPARIAVGTNNDVLVFVVLASICASDNAADRGRKRSKRERMDSTTASKANGRIIRESILFLQVIRL